MFGTGKIIEALATIKADTNNHKDDLKEMKEAFWSHIKEQAEIKSAEIKERARSDKKFGEDIASLQSRSKYNLISVAGLWTTMGIILKKLFT